MKQKIMWWAIFGGAAIMAALLSYLIPLPIIFKIALGMAIFIIIVLLILIIGGVISKKERKLYEQLY